jgi:hypothetical protein
VLAAALPYVNVGTAVLPTTRVLTPAGRAAIGADAAERLAQKQILATVDRPPMVGVHISGRPGLSQISPRSVGQRQVTAADALVGSSYMYDARSPRMLEQLFPDDPLRNAAYGDTPSLYVTRPQGRVFADSNVPVSPALRVQGPQQVLAEIPYDKQALQTYLQKLGVVERGATADKLEQMYRSLSPVVEQQIANRGNQMAEEGVRMAVKLGQSGTPVYLGLSSLDPNAPLGELLTNPQAKEIYDYMVPNHVKPKPSIKRDSWAVRPIHPKPR